MQIEKVYEPQRFEPHWAQWWIDSGIFHASSVLGTYLAVAANLILAATTSGDGEDWRWAFLVVLVLGEETKGRTLESISH